jgi:hypothetical protein
MSKGEAVQRRDLIKQGFNSLHRGSHVAFATLGEILTLATQKKDYKHLGYETAEQYFEHEIGECKTTCHNMMDYFEVIVPMLPEHPKIEAFPISTISQQIIPLLRKNVKITEIIPIANDIPKDRKERFKQLKGGTAAYDCQHDFGIKLEKCVVCGEIRKG